jgi:cytochrome P450
LKLLLGEGLLTSENEFWKRQRRLTQPAFHHHSLKSFATTMVEYTTETLEHWKDHAKGTPIDIHDEMMRLTFRIVGKTLFSADLERDAQAVGRALTVALNFANDYGDAAIRMPTWLPLPKNVRFRRALRTLDEMVARIISEHRGEPKSDLLGMLMAATDEFGERMSDRQLRDEVMTLVLAGYETTANALSWLFYLLASHPEIESRLHRELSAVLADRTPTLEDLPRLKYAEQVIQEAMRLYPPAWMIERHAVGDDLLPTGFAIPAGAIVAISPYVLHRNTNYWNDPERFDPDRFDHERSAGRPRYSYLPFGAGSRVCIGNSFAMMEAKLILAMVTMQYRLEVVADQSVELEPKITLRPRFGIKVRVHSRPNSAHVVSEAGRPRSGSALVKCMAPLVLVGAALASTSAIAADWKQIESGRDFKLFELRTPNTSAVAFKGEATIDAPLSVVANLFLEHSRYSEWVPDVQEAYVLRKVSAHEYVEYEHIRTPFIIKDRDFVTDVRVSFDPQSKSLLLEAQSASSPGAPTTKYVRGEVLRSRFVIQSLDEGRCRLSAELQIDARGAVPMWIVNLFQRDWPKKALASARKQAQKSDLRPSQEFPEILREIDAAFSNSPNVGEASQKR